VTPVPDFAERASRGVRCLQKTRCYVPKQQVAPAELRSVGSGCFELHRNVIAHFTSIRILGSLLARALSKKIKGRLHVAPPFRHLVGCEGDIFRRVRSN
jgi:hypothetical protein